MNKGLVHAYWGKSGEKTSLAMGKAVSAAGQGQSVILVQFLKEKDQEQLEFIQQLEPQVKVFRFEKSQVSFDELSETEKQDELKNIRNGLNFSKKVLTTKECDLLVLDGLMDLLDYGIVTNEEIESILEAKSETVAVILTGSQFMGEVPRFVDEAVKLENI